MKKFLLLSAFILISLLGFAQPANDNCSTAQNLGTLPTPAACPNGVGSSVNVVGTTINGTYPLPYTYLLGCQTGGDQPGPAVDVWYRFVASGNSVTINITPGNAPILQNPSIALWSGTCNNLSGVNCDNNGTNNGNNTATFEPITPGQTYYIQISGMTSTSVGNFNMAVNASNDCNNCLQVSSLTATPSPINGTYQPGQTINFCYTITTFTQVSANWLHGVIPTFGNGWDLTTLTTTPSAACATNGSWQWYNTNTSSATGNVTGPGFYFNSGAQPAGNNYGDANSAGCTRTFCWSIKTKNTCTSGSNLSISINTTSDGETGSWTSPACQGDPNYNFSSSLNCCSTTASGTPPTCFNGTNGSATATPNGVAPYTYSWNTTSVQNGQTATNLSPGNYMVTVTDNGNCVSTATVSLTNPPQITTVMNSTNVTCNGANNGQATVTPNGGTPPYTYSWNTTSVQNGQTATNLSPGNYMVTVTSANNCQVTNTVTITEPSPISVVVTSTSSTCGQPNGSATATPSGGTAPYTYSWNSTPVQTGGIATGLPSGNYTVTVTGTGSCTATGTVNISQSGSLTATATSTDVRCFGGNDGTATVTPSGGTNYTYLWNTTPPQNLATANLSAGTWSCTVTSGQCSTSVSVTIAQPTQLASAITTTGVSCNGGSNGTATATPTGGTSPYTYSWNTIPTQVGQTATGLMSGTYSVIISDANNCQISASANITQPTALSLVVTNSQNPTCFGGNDGSITVSSSGGVGPTFIYTLNSGTGQTSPTFSNLGSSNYTITVSDGSCQTQVTQQLTQPTQVSSISSVTNPSCATNNNGQILLTPTGGNPTYTFAWSNSSTSNPLTGIGGGTYSVTIRDANNCQITLTGIVVTQPLPLVTNPQTTNSTVCIGQSTFLAINPSGGTTPYVHNWSNGATQAAISVSPSTTTNYTFTTTDANNCTTTGSILITVYPQLAVTSTATQGTICIGQSTQLSAFGSGGNGGSYVYTWNPGNLTGQTVSVNPQTSTNFTVSVSDNCSPASTSTLVISVSQSPQVIYSTTNLSGCEPLTVTFTNSTPNSATCLWQILGNTSSNCVVTQSFQSAGTYSVQLQVTNSFGCQASSSPIIVNVYPIPDENFTSNPQVTNIYEPTISFQNLSTSGSYTWNFGDGFTSQLSNPAHEYSDTGTYVVQLIVTSQYGCKDTTYSTVYVDEIFSVYMPNAFTPNGDTKNETFGPVIIGSDSWNMSIYNRWGEMIYQSDGNFWDGTVENQKVQQDTYIWKLQVVANDKKRYQFVGKVTLIR